MLNKCKPQLQNMCSVMSGNCLCIQDGDTALHQASREGHRDTVELLLLKGAQVDFQNNVSMCVLCVFD